MHSIISSFCSTYVKLLYKNMGFFFFKKINSIQILQQTRRVFNDLKVDNITRIKLGGEKIKNWPNKMKRKDKKHKSWNWNRSRSRCKKGLVCIVKNAKYTLLLLLLFKRKINFLSYPKLRTFLFFLQNCKNLEMGLEKIFSFYGRIFYGCCYTLLLLVNKDIL